MNISGIITEYNPFHNGHKFHLENCKKDTNSNYTICIMSGHFVQRGEPALLDKWSRAKMAVLNGVDLVIELPLVYSISSAETFAYGAVKILDACKVVNSLYFGSEYGNIDLLKTVSSTLVNEPLDYRTFLKKYLDLGNPFHKARELALIDYLKNPSIEDLLDNSNNILGIEYVKALTRLKSTIKPFTLKREGSNYNDSSLSKTFSSATSIRKSFEKENSFAHLFEALPLPSLEFLEGLKKENYNFTFEESMFSYLKYRLLTSNINFNNLKDISEGLDNKILKEIETSSSYKDLILKIKSKRYTYTRISRILTQIFVNQDRFTLEELLNSALYIRPLSFNSRGASILKKIKTSSDIPIYTKLPKHIDNPSLSFDIQGTKAYSLLNSSITAKDDYFKSPIVIK